MLANYTTKLGFRFMAHSQEEAEAMAGSQFVIGQPRVPQPADVQPSMASAAEIYARRRSDVAAACGIESQDRAAIPTGDAAAIYGRRDRETRAARDRGAR